MKSFWKHSKALLFLCSILLIGSLSLPVSAAQTPAKVRNMKCGVTTQNSINISWQGQTGISGYQVYRASAYDGKYKKLLNINPNMHAFCNKNLKSGQEYYYKVRAYSGSGNSIKTGKFSNILTAYIKMPSAQKASTRVRVNVRKHAGTGYSVLATLNANTRVTVLCNTKDKSGTSWSHIQCLYGNRTLKGYIRSDLLKKTSTAKIGTVTAGTLNVRADAGISYRVVGTVRRGQKVTILGSKKDAAGTVWYCISFKQNGRTIQGYASSRYIKV